MAENNTTGAVHLTELSLDLTQFNENIRQIEQATAQVADVSVQNLSKIRDALNIPTDQITFKVDTSGITQNVDKAKESIEQFGNTVRSVSTEISGKQLFSSDVSAMYDLVKALGVADEKMEESVQKLATLGRSLDEYSKISISTSGGELFRAVITSSDEAGQSIRKVVDLTQELEKIDTEATVTISDNAQKRSADIERANANFVKQLVQINTNYEKLQNTISKKDLGDIASKSLIGRIEEAKTQIKALKEEVSNMNREVPVDYLSTLDTLRDKLKGIAIDFGSAEKAQREFVDNSKRADTLVRGYQNLQSQVSRLIATMTSTKFQGPDVSDWLAKAKELEQRTGTLAEEFRRTGSAIKEREKDFRDVASEVSNLNVKLNDIRSSNNEYKNSLIPMQEQARETITLLRSMEQATSFKGYKEVLSGLRSEYSSFVSDLRNSGMSADEAKAKLAGLDAQFQSLSSTVITNTDEINKLALDYARFANTISSSKFSEDTGMKAIIAQAKDAEASLKQMADAFSSGLFTAKDIRDAEAELARLTTELTNLKTQAQDAEPALRKMLQSADLADSLAKKYDEWQLKLAKIATDMSGVGLKMNIPNLDSFIAQANSLQTKAGEIAQSLRDAGAASSQSQKDLDAFEQAVRQLNIDFEAAKKSANDYKSLLAPIQQQAQETATALKALEKSAQFKTQKQEIADLRAEYENFINRLKSAGMSAEEAKSQLAGLDARFQSLQGSVNTSNTVLGRFAARLGETIKWRIAHSAITLLMQSFSGLTSTIKNTETAVVELQRVLGNTSVPSAEIAQSLYDIAYQFGHTFDDVQQVAVKFVQAGMDLDDALEATRVTMLGVNTAQLEVSTATEGLIAVMAQFKVEAEDLETVIDKINKTADNFPVTSEKIIEALQRAGGTASAFGMTLEETIGVITALSEATGRAGTAIGTALNSLISFSMKDTALAKFSEFLGQDVSNYGVIELWRALSEEIKGGNDELAKMMSQSEEFSHLMDEDLATAIGLGEEYNLALKEQNDLTAEGKDIIGVVGTYRQNYFIALLNNIQTAIDAIYGMRDAVGYAMKGNETVMESFSKKWNQLVISAQELAIQFGNSGFLDMMKVLVNIADLFLKITNNVGGLNTVLAITAAILYNIKKAQIQQTLLGWANNFVNLSAMIDVYNAKIAAGATATQAFGAAVATAKLSMAGFLGIAGLVITAIGGIIQWRKQAAEAQEQERAENIRAGKEAVKSIEEVSKAYVSYKSVLDDTSSTMKEVKDARQSMIDLIGIEKDENGNLIKKNGELIESYEELDGYIKQLTEDEYALAKAKAQQAVEDAKTNIAKSDTKLNAGDIGAASLSLFDSQSKVYWDMMNKNKDLLKEIQEILYSKPTPDNITKQIEKLSEGLKYIQANFDDAALGSDKFYQSIREQIEAYKELESELNNAQGNLDSLVEDFEHYANAVDVATDSTDEFTITAEKLAEDIESIGDITETLTGKIDEFQSAYQTLIGVIDEYNETGIMTADMLQSLLELEPEYIELLDIKGDSISINEEKLQDLIATNDTYLDQLVALKVAEEIDALMKDAQAAAALGLTLQEYALMDATDNLTLKAYALVQQFYNGEISTDQFRAAIAELGTQANITGSDLAYLTDRAYDLANGYAALFSQLNIVGSSTQQAINRANTAAGSIKRYYTPSSSSSRKSSGGSSSSKKEEDPFKAQKEALDDMLDAYEHAIKLIKFDNEKIFDSDKLKVNAEEIVAIYTQMQAKVHEMADAYRAADAEKYASEIRKMQDLWLDYEKKKAKAISDISGLLDAQEHEILLLEIANRKVVDPELQRKNAQQIVAINKKMQDEIHERADMLRDMGYKESSEYIRKLQEDWWRLQQENEKLMEEVYDDIVGTYENAINYLEHLFNQAEDNLDYGYMRNNLKKQMDYYVKIQETAVEQLKYLAEKGYDIASDEAQKWVDVFYEAGQAIKEISRQIAADILDPFDDFIDLADKFDIWEYMDFTKVDYLRDKLAALNKLFEEGTITAKQYNEELKSLSYAIYDAQRELFQKQQDEIEKAAQETIKAYNEEIKLLNKQKDAINDYYDDLIDGYNKEIEAWEKRKEEVSDYYDTLIDNLRDVEKANERINKQVDYYNERQKIITNLEQAQARSGVEWREKEIEYQQQLIDLDEDWRRTLEEWSIEDQIAALENLKETTLKDIELSIQAIRDTITAAQEAKQAALDAIDAEIEGIQEMIETVEKETEEAVAAIEEQIKDMSRTIAESIKSGVEDGLVDSKEELDKALVDGTNALLGFIDSNGKAMEAGVKEASANSYALYTAEFLEPYSDSVTEIASGMKDALAVGATEGAKEALSAFMTGFIEPLKKEMANILKQSETAKANISSATNSGSGLSGSSSSSAKSSGSTSSSSSSSKSITFAGAATVKDTPSFKDFYESNTPSQWEKFKNPTQVFITNYNNTLDQASNRTYTQLHNILGH